MKSALAAGIGVLRFLMVILAVANLPLDAIGHAASLRYGISVQAGRAGLATRAKGLPYRLLVGVPLALLFNWIVRVSPRRYWLWLWLISLPLIVISVFIAPLVIDPLFNKFEPLEKTHAVLVGKLEEIVARTGTAIPPERMFLMKASEKSNGINAYVTGIGSSKRFVMWDTTTDRMPDDEIMFIFGHESGHYVLNHIPKDARRDDDRIVLCLLGMRNPGGGDGAPFRRALEHPLGRQPGRIPDTVLRVFNCRLCDDAGWQHRKPAL